MRLLFSLIACCCCAAVSANDKQIDPLISPSSRTLLPTQAGARMYGGAVGLSTTAPPSKTPAGKEAPAKDSKDSKEAKETKETKDAKEAPAAGPRKSAEAAGDPEAELSAKIAARLAAMRATQQARAAAATAHAKKAAATKAAAAAVPPPPKVYSNVWSYEGETGPANWARINPAWAKCGSGNRQSPIDIRDGMRVDLEQINFDYHPSSFNVTDSGKTVQVMVGRGNFLSVGNRMYELVQFHFHRPSEERINGKGYEMVVHLVHKDGEGRIAMLALLLERGRAQPAIQQVWNNLPLEKMETMAPAETLDPMDLLPARREYYTFMGSMTTPPCEENVLWLVMKEPVQASPAQMAFFSRLYPYNARPVQPGSGRIIKESN
ncbi:carbonate dehydratase [Duganella sp. Leaf126]|uniref:carbonic anhydrase n=1 Tax=Duganella sp. Leaf126 TaxID=1736266 RepID=UPI0006F5621F|nr:carbonic anhydrase family protein [Duganella sp. Leaf126]KQQ33709.1 carbonate dehydratase [Duganella sp. Leaf126]